MECIRASSTSQCPSPLYVLELHLSFSISSALFVTYSVKNAEHKNILQCVFRTLEAVDLSVLCLLMTDIDWL